MSLRLSCCIPRGVVASVLLLGAASTALAQDDEAPTRDEAAEEPASEPQDTPEARDGDDEPAAPRPEPGDAAAERVPAAPLHAGDTPGAPAVAADDAEWAPATADEPPTPLAGTAESPAPTTSADRSTVPPVSASGPSAAPPGRDTGTEPATGGPATQKSEKLLPWRKTLLMWDNSVTTNTFSRGAQLSYNPTYTQLFSFRPRWYFTDRLNLRLRQDLIVELTQPDVVQQRAFPINSFIDLIHDRFFSAGGAGAGGGWRVLIPTSPMARAAKQILGTGPVLFAGWGTGSVLEGLSVTTMGRYIYFAGPTNVPRTETPFDCLTATPENFMSGTSVYCSGELSVVRHDALAFLDVNLGLVPRVDFAVSVGGWWRRGDDLEPAVVETATTTVVVEDESPTHWRNFWSTSVRLSYQTTSWLSTVVGWNVWATPQLNPDGSRRNPFVNPDTVVSLTALVFLDLLLHPDPDGDTPGMMQARRRDDDAPRTW